MRKNRRFQEAKKTMDTKNAIFRTVGIVLLIFVSANAQDQNPSTMFNNFLDQIRTSYLLPIQQSGIQISNEQRAKIIGYALQQQAEFAGNSTAGISKMNELRAEVRQFIGTISADQNLWPAVEGAERGFNKAEIRNLLGANVERVTSILGDISPVYEDHDHEDSAATIRDLTDQFMGEFSDRNFDRLKKYLAGEMVERINNLIEMGRNNPSAFERDIPITWKVLDVKPDEAEINSIVQAQFTESERFLKLVWEEINGAWKITKTEPFDAESLIDAREFDQIRIDQISEDFYRLAQALQAFNTEKILSGLTGKALEEFAQAFGSEHALKDAKEMFLGSLIHLGKIIPGESDNEAFVTVEIEHKEGESDHTEWIFRLVNDKWKLAGERK